MPNTGGTIQEFAGYTPDYGGPDPAYNALFSFGPNRLAQYQQSWRGFNTWNTGMGLEHYPPSVRVPIVPQPANAIYLGRNPPAWASASPIPIGQYVLSQQTSYTGG